MQRALDGLALVTELHERAYRFACDRRSPPNGVHHVSHNVTIHCEDGQLVVMVDNDEAYTWREGLTFSAFSYNITRVMLVLAVLREKQVLDDMATL